MPVSRSSPIQAMPGVGPKRAACYARLGIASVRDLTGMYPRTYIDFSEASSVADAPLNEIGTVRVVIQDHHTPVRTASGLTIYTVEAADDSAGLEIVFFNSPYRAQALLTGQVYYLRGKIEGNLFRKKITSPMVQPDGQGPSLVPLYPLTEGLTNKMVETNMRAALEVVLPEVTEDLPAAFTAQFGLPDAVTALHDLHLPPGKDELDRARRRVVCEELLAVGLGMRIMNARQKAATASPCHVIPMRDWFSLLPYALTNAQRRCIGEIISDMCGTFPMNRLLQGDVGSGKTVVAASAAFFAALNGYQTALLAPTELLAEQHARKLCPLFEKAGFSAELLTGSTKKVRRAELLERLAAGKIALLIGTHALLEEDVQFSSLGLVVTDEQHRFGVQQRARIYERGHSPHILVMSATPIPRTLALMLYGDLALSALDELPPGRLPIRTRRIRSGQLDGLWSWLREVLGQGRQAYVVCPSIEESETADMAAAETTYEQLRELYPEFGVRLLHGKMKPAEKDETMREFAAGQIQVLVSTTVVEVGVDVPNATVMLVENAERFGLSQLHQLRGRVGRGGGQSFCFLLSDSRSPEAEARLRTMEETQNGFEIAEADLRLRGPGDFLGSRQSGVPMMQAANMLSDMALTEQIAAYCDEVLHDDPALEAPEHSGLRRRAEELLEQAGTLN